jgi:hypothetical protein
MREEAQAFCAAGATSLGWYAWGDSEFRKATRTPYNSKIIHKGITDSSGPAAAPCTYRERSRCAESYW